MAYRSIVSLSYVLGVLLILQGHQIWAQTVSYQSKTFDPTKLAAIKANEKMKLSVLEIMAQSFDDGRLEKSKIEDLKKDQKYPVSMPIFKESQKEELIKQERILKEKQKVSYFSNADRLKLMQVIRDVLSGYARIEVIKEKDMLDLVDQPQSLQAQNPETAIQIAKLLDSDWVVLPLLYQIGDKFRLELALYDVATRKRLAIHQFWGKNLSELSAQQKIGAQQFLSKGISKYYAPIENVVSSAIEKQDEKAKAEEKGDILPPIKKPKDPELLKAWVLYQEAQKELDQRQQNLIANYQNEKIAKVKREQVIQEELAYDWEEIKKLSFEILSPKLKAKGQEKIPNWFDQEIPAQEEMLDPVQALEAEGKAQDQRDDQLDEKFLKEKILQMLTQYEQYPFAKEKMDILRQQYTWLNQQIHYSTVYGGTFQIGSTDNIPDEWPIQWITVKAFEASISEVTNAQYQKCVDEKACTPPHWEDGTCQIFEKRKVTYGKLPESWRRGDMPVVCVTWTQASTFAKWANARLLSEAEWEYVARNREKSYIYPWGTDTPSCEYAVMENAQGAACGLEQIWPVCSKPIGHNSFGMCDLAGNVWEWVMDSYRPDHEKVPVDAKPVLGGNLKVVRGGSFTSSPKELRASTRGQLESNRMANYLGFRIARDL